MTFAILNAAVADLRNALRSFVGEHAIGEITVRPPAGDGEEASFLRLVSWSYALVFESGRVTVAYLLALRGGAHDGTIDPREACQLVQALRTWSSHNLGFASDRDVALSQHVHRWFLKTCGAYPPNDSKAWRTCCQALCTEVGAIVACCQGAVTLVLTSPDDGQAAIVDLRRRIERNWPAHEFDKFVGDGAIRLGITVDVRKFREPRLAKWRAFVECLPDMDDPEAHMIRMIERDLLDHAMLVLPIDGSDCLECQGRADG